MWSTNKILAYLKVLAALAWADGELSNQELNYLKNLALKFRLPDKTWAELEPYLYDAITPEEAQQFLKEFLSLVSGAKEKKELLASLKSIADTDAKISSDEQKFLTKAAKLIESSSSFNVLTGSFRTLFSKDILTGPKSSQAINDFFTNKILYLLQRRIDQGKVSPVEPNRLKYLALFGGLLGRVAAADNDFSAAELNYLKLKLNKLGVFSPHEAALVATVVQEATLKGIDNARLTADFFEISTEQQRHQLVESLFALAAADGKVSNEEIEEIRSIANAFGFSHKQFIAAKLAAKSS